MAFILIIEFPKGWKKAKGERRKAKGERQKAKGENQMG